MAVPVAAPAGVVPRPRAAEPEPARRPARTRSRPVGTGLLAPILPVLPAVLAVLAFAIPQLHRELPLVFHPDEPTNLGVLLRMLARHDPNPHFFDYPSLFFTLNLLPYPVLALLGAVPPPQAISTLAIGVTRTADSTVFVVGRSVTLLCALLCVLLLYRAVRLLGGSRVAGAAAALLLALSPTMVGNSAYLTPDVPATAGVTGVLLASAWLLREPSARRFVVAGIAVGVATALKYNAVLSFGVVIAAALAAGTGEHRRTARRLAGAAVAAGVVFVLGTPFAVLDPVAFAHGAGGELKHYRVGHLGMEGHPLAWYLGYLAGTETVLAALAAIGVAVLVVRGRIGVLGVLGAFPVVYGAAISTVEVRNDRTVLLLVPMLAGLAGFAAGELAVAGRRARRSGACGSSARRADVGRPGDPAAWLVGVLLVGGLVVAGGVRAALADAGTVGTRAASDNRVAAATWLARALPAGSSVLLESYGPWIDPHRFRVGAVFALDQAPVAAVHGPAAADYVVTTSDLRGRYLADPGRYRADLAAYQDRLGLLTPLAVFGVDAGPVVTVYRTSR